MKTLLTSLEISYIVKELQFLIDSKIDNIYQPDKKELILKLYVSNKGKKILRISAGNMLYLTETKQEYGEPTNFCLFLRKHLNNARLRKVNQLMPERILEFIFEKKEGKEKLIIEMFAKGNIILTDDKGDILSAVEYHKFRDRTIRAHIEYKHPKLKYNFFNLESNDLINLFKESEKDSIVTCLAVDIGLGGVYSEEVCLLSNIDKRKKPFDLKEEEIKRLLESIKKLINKKIKPVAYYKNGDIKDIVPFELKIYETLNKKEFKTYNEALDFYFSREKTKESKELEKYKRELNRIKEIVKKQETRLNELGKTEKEYRKKAEIIYNNYQLINEILTKIRKAIEKSGWKEVKEKLKGHKIIKEINAKEKKIIVEIN